MKQRLSIFLVLILTGWAGMTNLNGQTLLYGMFYEGGTNNKGVLFAWDPATDTYTPKYDFDGINGARPQSSLVEYGGKFYGTTSEGGVANSGVLFEYDPVNNSYSKKYDFLSYDGGYPFGSMTLVGDKFYGMTNGGGINGVGVIFEYDPVSNIYVKKFDFDYDENGYEPLGSLAFYEGKLYGMTSFGGDNDGGVIFEWDPATDTFLKKIDFYYFTTGESPLGDLTLSGDKFYGTTSIGGGTASGGVLFEWDPATNNFVKKIAFNSNYGTGPASSLIQSGGKVYGVAGGGTNYAGVIFEWDPVTNTATKKFDFDGTASGGHPCTALTLSGGKFYGITLSGGVNDKGVFYEWDLGTDTYSKKVDLEEVDVLTDYRYFSLLEYTPVESWTGAVSSNWATEGNWASGIVPTSSTFVHIPDVANDPIVNEEPGTPAICGGMTIDAGAVLTIAAGKALTVSGTITNNAGTGGIVIQSDATGTGSLIQATPGVDGTMQRYIPQRTDNLHGWHFLSSPVAAQAIQTEFVPSPPGSGTQGFFSWDEPSDLWINTKDGIGNWAGGFESDFIPGKGYLVNYAADVTKNFMGTLNVADVTMPGLTKSATIYTGWHLLGNPFSSPLTWHTGWTLSNIAAVAKIWNGSGASYSDINPGDVIPATQGLMVQVTTAPGSVTIPAAARTHSTQAWYKSSGDPLIKLKANDLSRQTYQECVIRFDPNSTVGYDADYDSYFLPGYAPEFYAVENGEKLSTDVLPGMDWQTTIPLSFIPTEGSDYSIETVKLENMTQPVFLVDLKGNTTQNLNENPVYSFTASAADDPARFLLAFRPLSTGKQTGENTLIYSHEGILYIIDPGESHVEVFNAIGQKMIVGETHNERSYRLKLDLSTGLYIVRLTSGQDIITGKIFVK